MLIVCYFFVCAKILNLILFTKFSKKTGSVWAVPRLMFAGAVWRTGVGVRAVGVIGLTAYFFAAGVMV